MTKRAKSRRAIEQKIQGGMDLISKAVHRKEPSKAELRAMIPSYDPSIVRRIEPNVKSKRQAKVKREA